MMEELRDIKGLVAIEDSSLLIFIALTCSLVLLAFMFVRWLLKWRKRGQKHNQIAIAKDMLQNLDISNSKETSYKIGKWGRLLCAENPEHIALFEKIFELTNSYKYQKEVPPFGEKEKNLIQEFVSKVV
ncbi:MAG: hypothetical protein PHN38_00625 [Sulfurospirillaceae bacterium]|nr:hypothetical protein [Sulfurospirillaceae bacterium]MDD3462136.1 hypothetical protein [Sulfurospirillaceae bacterium]